MAGWRSLAASQWRVGGERRAGRFATNRCQVVSGRAGGGAADPVEALNPTGLKRLWGLWVRVKVMVFGLRA